MIRPAGKDCPVHTAGAPGAAGTRPSPCWPPRILAWVIFDVSTSLCGTSGCNAIFYPLPSLPLVVPAVAARHHPFYDRIKGIEPHRDTQRYLEQFKVLDQDSEHRCHLASKSEATAGAATQLTLRLLEANPFLSSGNTGALEKIKNRLRAHAGLESARQSATLLLDPDHIKEPRLEPERQFWTRQILPLVEINYWRSLDDSGQLTISAGGSIPHSSCCFSSTSCFELCA
ncbi:MAG: hypothetical protein CM15mP77_3180 [Synechococcus sp.]|nr:MAG: hypothetical protein CM15mP77_3180 [Synechococcus sp.]